MPKLPTGLAAVRRRPGASPKSSAASGPSRDTKTRPAASLWSASAGVIDNCQPGQNDGNHDDRIGFQQPSSALDVVELPHDDDAGGDDRRKDRDGVSGTDGGKK